MRDHNEGQEVLRLEYEVYTPLAVKEGLIIIDEVKQRLPIWKKEYYASGEAEWVNCQHCAHPM